MISVVTITYNNYEELIETLDSIKGLTSVQSIVVNGGSCEKTRNFLSSYPGVVISEKDHGISDAFNKGLKLAEGTGVMFLNSGDRLIFRDYPAVAEELLGKYDFIHSDIIFDDAITGPIRMKPALCSVGYGMPYFHQSMVIKSEWMRKAGLFDLNFKIAMDYDYVIRLQKLGARGYYFNAAPTIHMDGQGISATQENKSLAECYTSMKKNDVLNLQNRAGFALRKARLSARQTLTRLGLPSVIGWIKKIKHS